MKSNKKNTGKAVVNTVTFVGCVYGAKKIIESSPSLKMNYLDFKRRTLSKVSSLSDTLNSKFCTFLRSEVEKASRDIQDLEEETEEAPDKIECVDDFASIIKKVKEELLNSVKDDDDDDDEEEIELNEEGLDGNQEYEEELAAEELSEKNEDSSK